MDKADRPCRECGTVIEWLAVFPGGRCVECHARVHADDTYEDMARDIRAAFGGRK